MPNFLHKKFTFSMYNRILVDTTQDLTFKVIHKVIKVKFVIFVSLSVLGSISVSNSNIDIGENQTQKCVFLRDSYSLPVLF